MQDLGERVRYLLDNSAGSHREFAAAVGIEPTKLSKSLTGVRRFRPEELAAIAETAHVSLEWLLHGAGPTPNTRVPGPPTTGRTRDARRREEILEATWRLIAHRGYHRVRIADIAQACGTSPAAIHYYFPGKEDVMQTAVLHCAECAFDRQSLELSEIGDSRKQLLQLIELQIPVPGQIRDEWMIWLQLSSESSLRPELRAVHNDFHLRWRGIVADIVRRGQQQGQFHHADPERIALAFMSLADGLAIQLLTATPGNTADTMRGLLVDFAEHAIMLPADNNRDLRGAAAWAPVNRSARRPPERVGTHEDS